MLHWQKVVLLHVWLHLKYFGFQSWNQDLVCSLYFGKNCRKRGNTKKEKKRLKIGCNSMFGAALTDRLEMWDFYSLSPGFLSTLCCRTNICTFVQLGGGVRLNIWGPVWVQRRLNIKSVTQITCCYILHMFLFFSLVPKLRHQRQKERSLKWSKQLANFMPLLPCP